MTCSRTRLVACAYHAAPAEFGAKTLLVNRYSRLDTLPGTPKRQKGIVLLTTTLGMKGKPRPTSH